MFARTLAAAVSVFALVACAGNASEDAASSDQDVTSGECGASYAPANDLYKAAVAIAKQHKVSACEGVNGSDEGAYLTTLAAKAAQASTTCNTFSNVIKTSPWAAPIREELAGNLALAVLTGDLEIKDASGAYTFKGLATALPGVTLWGPAPGAYGNASKIEFAADGKATISRQEWDDSANMPTWKSEAATWAITGIAAGDSIGLTITTGGISTDYDLKATSSYEGGPDFELAPIEKEGDTFTAYISECEA